MSGRDLFRAQSAADEQESLEVFLASYYNSEKIPPVKIFLQNTISSNTISNWFIEKFDSKPELLHPTEKQHISILAMARHNALEDLRKRLKQRGAGPAMDEMARVLNLSGRPQRIEGFDISHLDGQHPVASMVSFNNGVPDKKNYRYFKLRNVIGRVDDYAAMREVIRRRYSRLIREGKELPDLILVDGGIGQVNAAKGVLDELGLDTGLAGIAKRDEELWLAFAAKPVILPRSSEALKVLQHIRDESHRFATGLNKRLRSRDFYFKTLESVKGIGKQRAAAIMKSCQTIEAVAAASPADLAARCRLSLPAAKAATAAARLALEDSKSSRQKLAGY